MSQGTLRFLVRRLGWALLVVVAVTMLTFVVNRAVPSDPAQMVAGPQARPADVARIRAQLGLDRPMSEQLVAFGERLVHFGPARFDPDKTPDHATCGHIGPLHLDLGRSFQQRRSVVSILAAKLPATIALAIAGTLLSVIFGVVSALIAVVRRGTWVDTGIVALAIVGISTPTFILGVVLQYVFGYALGVLPIGGGGQANDLVDGLKHLVLPALTLGLFGAAYYTRLVRADLLELLNEDFLRTARAKGASGGRVLIVHALRNALLPLATAVGLDFGALLGGAVITEQIFSYPGVGALAVRAVRDRDGPVIIGTVLVGALAIVLVSLAVDLAYLVLDPRVAADSRSS